MISRCVFCIIIVVLTAADPARPKCALPPHPDHGRHVPYSLDCPEGSACQGVPGTWVDEDWTLFLRCDFGYHTNASDIPSVCTADGWLPPLSSCVELERRNSSDCELPEPPARVVYEALQVECGLGSSVTPEVGTPVPSDCVLLYSCSPGYQLTQPQNQLISICQNTSWQPPSNTFSCSGSTKSLPAQNTNNTLPDWTPTPTTIPTSRPTALGCNLPSGPANRKFCNFRCKDCSSQSIGNCSYAPGTSVSDVALKVQCRQGYGLPDKAEYVAIVCLDNRWFPEIPDCQKLCPPLESDSVYPQCQYGTSMVDCSQAMLPGTTAVYQCRPSYSEYPGLTAEGVYKRTISCRQNGKWSNPLPECKPAAHCVAFLEPEDLRVAMGKYYRSWDHDEEYAVTRNVSAISIPQEYLGAATTYSWDIALVLLAETVQFTSFVMPVCRDITGQYDITRNTGYVVGWGRTAAEGNESETLLSNNLNILDYTICRRKLPQILAFDKFCGDKGSVSVAEKGDSGGGLTAVFGGLHYIFGIVSLKHNNLTVFTNISWTSHLSWIEHELLEFNKLYDYR